LRAVALVAVLLYHALPATVPGGFLGVEVFFVLSGFLLASILLDEHARTGAVDWRGYLLRRARRLVPALVAMLGALVLVAPFLFADDAHRLAGDVYSSLLGVTNWHLIHDHSSYFGGLGRPPLVRHLWSLAIELQFYAVCPFVVAGLARRRHRVAMATVASAIGASSVAMLLLFRTHDASRAYYGTDTRVGAMFTGVLLALALRRSQERTGPRRLPLAGLAAAAGLVVLFARADDQARWLYPAGFLLTQAATAVLITRALRPGRVAAALEVRPLRWLGERSYGTYLWHWPLVALLRPRVDVTWSPLTAAFVTIAAAIALGHLSFVLLEQPRSRARHALPGGDLVRVMQWSLASIAAIGMATLVRDLPRTDPIVSSLREGQHVVSLQSAAPTTTVAPTTTTAPPAPAVTVAAAPAPTTPPPPAGPPPGSVKVAAIGDSVMLGAAGPLQARLGDSGYIDAKVGRQYAQGVDVAREMREQGRLGEAVIVHLGTNGPPRDRDVDALMGQLTAVPHVLFVTVRMPRNWEAATNNTLRASAARYPTITIVDWHGYSDGHPEWFQSDGVHLRPPGAQAYAQLIGGALPAPPPPPPPPTTTTEAPATTVPPETTTTTAPADALVPQP
jgi:peptidoglycan/LPS O-acetylase OafA/YrhL